mgnify:CR=1 FL=1
MDAFCCPYGKARQYRCPTLTGGMVALGFNASAADRRVFLSQIDPLVRFGQNPDVGVEFSKLRDNPLILIGRPKSRSLQVPGGNLYHVFLNRIGVSHQTRPIIVAAGIQAYSSMSVRVASPLGIAKASGNEADA